MASIIGSNFPYDIISNSLWIFIHRFLTTPDNHDSPKAQGTKPKTKFAGGIIEASTSGQFPFCTSTWPILNYFFYIYTRYWSVILVSIRDWWPRAFNLISIYLLQLFCNDGTDPRTLSASILFSGSIKWKWLAACHRRRENKVCIHTAKFVKPFDIRYVVQIHLFWPILCAVQIHLFWHILCAVQIHLLWPIFCAVQIHLFWPFLCTVQILLFWTYLVRRMS